MGEEYGVGSGHAQGPLLQMAELRVQAKVGKITAATADLVQWTVSGRFGNAGADAHEHVMEVPRDVTEAAPARVPQMAGNPVLERTRKR